MKKIYFIVPYPQKLSPSQRFRFEQYFPILRENGYAFTVSSFLTANNWRYFYQKGRIAMKVMTLLTGILDRLIALSRAPRYDFIFIHREAMPLGPPVIEWLLAKVFRKKIIYDFDDAIWLTDRQHESWIRKVGKWRKKVSSICGWAHKISCGNENLCDYAVAFNPHIIHNPTTIDTENHHNPGLFQVLKDPDVITIGWTGSQSTLKYLKDIESVLKQIQDEHKKVQIVIIADHKPESFRPSYQFITWNPETEIEDLMKIDIGIMPLPDNDWAKGKCGFKALQYMALEIPAVVSPVGVNTKIVDHGINGFLACTKEEWHFNITQLINDAGLRRLMGKRGREKIMNDYSVISNSSAFLSLFE